MAIKYTGTILGGQTCLEQFAMKARKEQLTKNEWGKHTVPYTKELVRAEYDIQRRFQIS